MACLQDIYQQKTMALELQTSLSVSQFIEIQLLNLNLDHLTDLFVFALSY